MWYKTSQIKKFLTDYQFMKDKVLAYIPLMDALAEKRFPDSSLAGEAMLFVLEKLEEGDWKRVRSFQGKSQFSTFLSVLTRRLLEDFSRKKFKRVRPPQWLKQLGGLWLEVFRHLCLDRHTVPETVESMVAAVPERSREAIEDAAHAVLLKIYDCGNYFGAEFQSEDSALENAANKRNNDLSQEDTVYEKNSRLLLEAIFQTFLDDEPVPASLAGLCRKLDDLDVSLTPEQGLLLRLRFVEGMSVSAVCRKLGLADYRGRSLLKNTLATLREQFQQVGIEDQIRELLLHKDSNVRRDR